MAKKLDEANTAADPVVTPDTPVAPVEPVVAPVEPVVDPTPAPVDPVVDPVVPTPEPVVDPAPAPEPTLFDEIEAKFEEVVSEVETKIGEITKTLSEDFSWFAGISVSVLDYSKHVGLEEAIKLLQKILGISKTGVIDDTTKSAWNGSAGKRELIDDYNNLRKDNFKDLKDVRDQSKKEL